MAPAVSEVTEGDRFLSVCRGEPLKGPEQRRDVIKFASPKNHPGPVENSLQGGHGRSQAQAEVGANTTLARPGAAGSPETRLSMRKGGVSTLGGGGYQ